jgi:5'(3')-deoxyribonucleotidase
MRPLTIAVDVDETVADLLGPWLRRYNATYGDILLPEDLVQWDLAKAVKPECGEAIYQMLDASLYAQVLPLPGARAAVAALRSLGHRVLFVSSCTAGTATAKMDWLIDWGFLPRQRWQPDFVAATDKTLIRADVMLDDCPRNVDAFEGLAWLIDQPQNRDYAGRRPRLRSLAQAPAAITQWLADSPYRDL